jgi:hypothetical protein
MGSSRPIGQRPTATAVVARKHRARPGAEANRGLLPDNRFPAVLACMQPGRM